MSHLGSQSLTPLWTLQVPKMPFSMVYSQNIFYGKTDQIIEHVKGALSIVNDITVHGHTEENHDAHQCNLRGHWQIWPCVRCKKNVTWKLRVAGSSIVDAVIMVYSLIKLYVNATADMPAPTSVKEIKDFSGNAHVPEQLYTATPQPSSTSFRAEKKGYCTKQESHMPTWVWSCQVQNF